MELHDTESTANERRAAVGAEAVRAAAELDRVGPNEPIDTTIIDVLADIAHLCDRIGLDAEATFACGLRSYRRDFEDGPPAKSIPGAGDMSAVDVLGRGGQSFGEPKVKREAPPLRFWRRAHLLRRNTHLDDTGMADGQSKDEQ